MISAGPDFLDECLRESIPLDDRLRELVRTAFNNSWTNAGIKEISHLDIVKVSHPDFPDRWVAEVNYTLTGSTMLSFDSSADPVDFFAKAASREQTVEVDDELRQTIVYAIKDITLMSGPNAGVSEQAYEEAHDPHCDLAVGPVILLQTIHRLDDRYLISLPKGYGNGGRYRGKDAPEETFLSIQVNRLRTHSESYLRRFTQVLKPL